MNMVVLVGRTTTDIELKTTPNGVSVASFVLAVDRRTKEDAADFPTVVAWRQTAEFASKYIQKGRKIVVQGEIRTRNYEDRDGKKRKVTEIHATNIEFADSKPTTGNGNNATAAPGPAEGFDEIPGDEDLPL